MPAASDRPSPLALVVLAMLVERPMHPYLMFQLMTQRGKSSIVNIAQRNSLYQVIDRLVRAGLAEIESTEREENRPERTVYRITPLGETTARAWVVSMLSAERSEYPAFPAALSLLALVPPTDALEGLKDRRASLEARLASETSAVDDALAMGLPRLFVLDDDYRVAMLRAELRWITPLIDELERGELTWSREWIAEIAARFEPTDA